MREEVLYVIFLDLTKAYDALDRSRCLGILEGYGVGPGAMRLLQNYWRRLTMAARSGGYYGKAFKGARGVTQGDPLSPKIFNMVVDAVVRHWLEGLQTATEEKGATGRERHFSAVFYANNGMVVPLDPEWLQGAFSALVAIFDRVGLRTNVDKTVSMACHPCRAGTGNWTTEGYRRRLMGDGSSFRERQRERVACGECGAELTAGSLLSHIYTVLMTLEIGRASCRERV